MKYTFMDNQGTFRMDMPEKTSYLYFPIAQEMGLKSSITPSLGGDSKIDQNTFLLQPVSSEELHNNRSTRNFWCRIKNQGIWSATGVSAAQEAKRFSENEEKSFLEAGLMWHKMTRESEEYGLASEITSFVPVNGKNIELMDVVIKNTKDTENTFTPFAAVPLYARSADNLRDHRHVTSLLHRIDVTECGVFIEPTLTFDERGHKKNTLVYGGAAFALDGSRPAQFFPIVEEFIGEGGSFLMPKAVYQEEKGMVPGSSMDGYEAMCGVQFEETTLAAGETKRYIVAIGIGADIESLQQEMRRYSVAKQADEALELTKKHWLDKNNVTYASADAMFDRWMYWVDFQPALRRIYGCSFLPHHDYGKGGRGWRDLWQDCLALLVMDPENVRGMLLDNFGGVRIDGSNATIIGEKQGEFIADRNNITRVWMDHGVWPYMTTELYTKQTGDLSLLQKEMPYFKDAQIFRGAKKDTAWTEAEGKHLKTAEGNVYYGTVLEHLLVQHLTSFYDVGEHNHIKLRGADWNDAIDMAGERGESVAFTAAYAGNLSNMAELLAELKNRNEVCEVELAEEIFMLLEKDVALYNDVAKKNALLDRYFESCKCTISGKKQRIAITELITVLQSMSQWIKEHIRESEWITTSENMHWYNGYYDNHGKAVEGEFEQIRMMLTGQVFSVMSKVATNEQVAEIVKAVDKYLYNPSVGGYRLNTDFEELKMDMGRMFGFAYGHKENGAVFSHMAIMYANALYQRGFSKEGYKVIDTLYRHCTDFESSKIYPGIPEYFDAKGRGMYHYLTGAASWLMLTVLTEMFGVKGCYGDLKLEPKLVKQQFDAEGKAGVKCQFAGKNLEIIYHNPKHLECDAYKIAAVKVNGKAVDAVDGIIRLADLETDNHIEAELGE